MHSHVKKCHNLCEHMRDYKNIFYSKVTLIENYQKRNKAQTKNKTKQAKKKR